MPKRNRQCFEGDISEQPLKKQISVNGKEMKIRGIRSVSTERTINMLFKAASKSPSKEEVSPHSQCPCSTENHENECYFCDKKICSNCVRPCDICDEIFCSNCSFLMYDENYDCLCYACMKNK